MRKCVIQKAISMFLAVVLILGLLPLSAFAAGGGASGGSLVNPTQPGGTATGWNTARKDGAAIVFTRYSLYKFPYGVDGSNWCDGANFLASVDIVPDAQKATIQGFGKIFWFDTDAVKYRKAAQNGTTSAEGVAPHVWNLLSGNMKDDWGSRILSTSDVFGAGNATNAGDLHALRASISAPSSTWNPLLQLFADGYNGSSYVIETWNDDMGSLFDIFGGLRIDEFKTATDGSGSTYRVIVEPGILIKTQNAIPDYYAFTLRDMAANELWAAHDAGLTIGDWCNRSNSLAFAIGRHQDGSGDDAHAYLMHPLYEAKDGFTVLENGELKTVSSPVAYNGAKNDDLSTTNAMRLSTLIPALFGIGAGNWAVGEYAPYGMGVLLPDMVQSDEVNPTLTLSKTIEGETEGYADKSWCVDVLYSLPEENPAIADAGLPANTIVRDAEGTVIGPDNASGTSTATTLYAPAPGGVGDEIPCGLRVWMKAGETVSIEFEMPEGKTLYYHVEETLAEEDKALVMPSYTLNGTVQTGPAWANTTDQPNAAVEVKNTIAKGEYAHLIIDYNLTGSWATDGSGNPSETVTQDCGAILYNDANKPTVSLVPTLNGERLYNGYTKNYTVDGVKVTMTYKGLYTTPQGSGEDLTGKDYTLQHAGLTILYCKWDISTEGATTGDSVGSNLYTIFWDYNYTGAAVTTTVAGNFSMNVRTGAAITSETAGDFIFYMDKDDCTEVRDDDGNLLGYNWNSGSYTPVKVKIPFVYPGYQGEDGLDEDYPTRNGWSFLGWSSRIHPEAENTSRGYIYGDDAWAYFNSGSGVSSARPVLCPEDPQHSATYHAIWKAGDISWDANGGIFDMTKPPVYQGNGQLVAEEDTPQWVPNADNTIITWLGWIDEPKIDIPIIKRQPERKGYVFDKWYLDVLGNVPITNNNEGVEPSRTYYAGWTPQPVKVNYYDCRQGSSLVTTQTYNYNDVFSLLGDLSDTDGQSFTGWKVASVADGKVTDTGAAASASGVNLVDGVMGITYHPNTTSTTPDTVGEVNGYWEINLVASWGEETATYKGTIVWDDANNNDGVRPSSVTVALVSSVANQAVATQTVTGPSNADTWTYEFPDLPITTADASAEKITYSTAVMSYTDFNGKNGIIKDTAASDIDILADLTDSADNPNALTYKVQRNNISSTDETKHWVSQYNGTVYFTHELVRINYPFHIYWKDQYNNDGYRPGYVKLNLYANGRLDGGSPYLASEAVSETEDHGAEWCFYFPNIRKFYNEGELVDYTVSVESLNQVNMDVPAAVTSDKYKMKYVNDDNDEATPPATKDRNGVTFGRVIDLADYPGKIIWDDEGNRDNLRPEKVAVHLVAYQWNQFDSQWETKIIDTITATGGATADEWTFTFTDEPVFCGGAEVVYTIALGNLNAGLDPTDNRYTWEFTNYDERAVTATHVRNLNGVTAKVEWKDENNADGLRPEAILMRLYADGVAMEGDRYTAVVAGGDTNVWEHTFTDLPQYAAGESGRPIVYSIGIEEVNKDELYGSFISMATGEQTRVQRYAAQYYNADGEPTSNANESVLAHATLIHVPQLCTFNAYVSWHDENNKDGKRPDYVLVDFYQEVHGEKKLLETLNITAGTSGTWSYKKTGLPVYDAKEEIRYFVEVSEDFRNELAKVSYTVECQDNVAHLYHVGETGTVNVAVNWADNNNNDGLRPENLAVRLYANGVATEYPTVLLNAKNNWTGAWSDLPTYFADKNGVGQKVQYSAVVEDVGEGYVASCTPEAVSTLDDQTIYITMSHGNNLQAVEGHIYWNDSADSDGGRPASVAVRLLADGVAVPGKVVDVTGEGNDWTFTFDGVPSMQGGKTIQYTVELADATEETYEAVITGTSIYLYRDAVTASMYVSFQFNDRNNADGQRPTGLYLQLIADGEPVTSADGLRTVSFDTLVDGSKWTFDALPVYSAPGKRVEYSVKAILDATLFGGEDYTATYSAPVTLSTGVTPQIVVKLSKQANTAPQKGSVYWFDNNNQRGNRPGSLTISVKSNESAQKYGPYTMNAATKNITDQDGNIVGAITAISEWGDIEKSRWEYEIYNLPLNTVYSNGVAGKISYYAELDMSGLDNWYTGLSGESRAMNITMTHKNYADDRPNSYQNFDVTVNWADNGNAWNYRPNGTGVDITMLANGAPTDYRVHMTPENATETTPDMWTYRFETLPTYLNGSAVAWTAEISDHDKYTASEASHGTYSVITMTQTGEYDLTVRWDDADDNDHKRPEEIQVSILADGAEVAGSPVTLTGDGNVWAGHIDELPVWRTNGSNLPVSYSIQIVGGAPALYEIANTTTTQDKWGDTTDATMRDLKATWETTLAHSKETLEADFVASVTFDDKANQDGIRPETIYVTLLADGEPVGEPVAVTGSMEENTWTYAWDKLYLYNNGTPIVYSVRLEQEDTYTGYTAVTDGAQITLTHVPETVSVTVRVNWMDNSELHYKGDSTSETYAGIQRVDTYLQLLANGVPVEGKVKKVPATAYLVDGVTQGWAQFTWNDLDKKAEGVDIVYTFTVSSPELDALLADGFTLAYDESEVYKPQATISHDFYDVRGTVYFLSDANESFRLGAGIPVTAYRYDPEANTYTTVGSAKTDENGSYAIYNVPDNSLLVVRATYTYANAEYAGAAPVKMYHMDNTANVVIDRDSSTDSGLYLYSATGNAYYQTDKADPDTIHPVPEGSIVLLYSATNDSTKTEYLSMTTTDANGGYSFNGLTAGKYLVNVVFNYEGGTYTIDNGDLNGQTFIITGADAKWPDVVKQVAKETPVDPEKPVEPDKPIEQPEAPKPCVVSGKVYYSNNGVHTTNPVQGVDVYLYTSDTNSLVAKTKTDENGAWSVEGFASGDYIAVFSMQGAASRVLRFAVSDQDYETGAKDLAEQYFDINGETGTATIRGVVLDESGLRENAMVKVLDERNELVDFGYADKDGLYKFTVPAGHTYRVQIVRVGTKETSVVVGTPGTGLMSLDYFTISGNFSVDGAAQVGQTITVYKEQADMTYKLVTATLTDAQGNYTAKVAENGNYKVISYLNNEVYDEHMVSVGLAGTLPTVSETNGTYTIFGSDAYTALILHEKCADGATREVKSMLNGSGYALSGLAVGTYDLEITNNGKVTHYYLDLPDNKITKGTVVTISGTEPTLGAVVEVLDANGASLGETFITDGFYAYKELPIGNYTVRTTYPVMGDVLADKTTAQEDSYGVAYAAGMTSNGTWTLNINAVPVNGTVLDQQGRPVPGASVTLRSKDDPDMAYATVTNEGGTWAIGVAPDTYIVDAMMEVDGNHVYHATETKAISAQTATSNVSLTIPSYDLTVYARKAGDNSVIAGAKVTVSYADGTQVWSGETNDNGAAIVRVYGDTYKVDAESNGKNGTTSVKVDGDKTVDVTLDIPVTLSGIVKTVSGKVLDDAIVHYEGVKSGVAYTDSEGRYVVELNASELGNYALWVEAQGESSEKVDVTVKGDTVMDLTVADAVATRTIAGVVTDNKGNRLENATVTALYGNDKELSIQTSTNRNGEYRFAVEDGTYYLTATYDVYQTNGETAVHVNGSDVVKNLAVALSHPVTISVKDTAGNPCVGATVTYFGTTSGSAQVDNEGKVTLDLADGDYTFSAIVGKRESAPVHKAVTAKTNVELVVGLANLVFTDPTITPTGKLAVSGKVYDTNGKAVNGATVSLERFDFDTNEWKAAETQTTNENGYYFGNLENGRYRVRSTYTQTFQTEGEPSAYAISGKATDESGNVYTGGKATLINPDGTVRETIPLSADGTYSFVNLAAGEYTVKITATDGTVQTIETPTIPTKSTISGTALDVSGKPVSGAVVVVTADGGEWSATTGEDGKCSFALAAGKTYTVSITYPKETVIETATYAADKNDRNAPELTSDSFTVTGKVMDSDGNTLNGATIILKDSKGNTVTETRTDENGTYILNGVTVGEYTIFASWNDLAGQLKFSTNGNIEHVDPVLPEETVKLSGIVVTDKDNPIPGAKVTIHGLDTDVTIELTADKDGRFVSGDLAANRYEVTATYAHKYGSNQSDRVLVARGHDDIVLVIVPSYTKDVNGDDKDETVYAGEDDTFDTEDDFYQAKLPGQDAVDSIYAGEDKAPGTPDDFYERDLNNDGTKEPIHVGEDRLPGTADDRYLKDADKDGQPDKVFAGEDKLPGTTDDFYSKTLPGQTEPSRIFVGDDKTPGTVDDYYFRDIDNDGEDETIHVGDDTIPGTSDDWYDWDSKKVFAGEDKTPGTKDDYYEADPDKDGVQDKVYVGEDTKPGTEDDWYEKDVDGDGKNEQVFVGPDGTPGTSDDTHAKEDVVIWFNANGGTVENKNILGVKLSEFSTMPTANRSGYYLKGWYTKAEGGDKVSTSYIKTLTENTTVYAQWSVSGGGNIGGGGSSGGSSGGSLGGGTAFTKEITVTFDTDGGSTIAPQTIKSGTCATKPNDPVKYGYRFTGWKNEGKTFDFATKLKANITLKAQWEYVGVSGVLTDQHIAYIQGADDGLVHPKDSITRAEVVMIFYRLLNDKAKAAYKTSTHSFVDVERGAWYETAAATLANMGIVKGKGGNRFDPTGVITRAEFAAIAARFDKLENGPVTFPDVNKDHWAYAEITSAAAKGWVKGFDNGNFGPNNYISRAEAMTMVNRALGRDTITHESIDTAGMVTWADNADTSAWYYLAVQEATNAHTFEMKDSTETWQEVQKPQVSNQ